MNLTIRNLLTFILLLVNTFCYGQNTIERIQNSIDEQVWVPFNRAFEELDATSLNALYADKVIRVTPAGIDTKGQFRIKNIERFTTNKVNGEKIFLDFWFDSRNTNESTSYEVGYYKITSINISGEMAFHYGQFHIVLQKLEGQWKITQDWDHVVVNGRTISEEDFKRKSPIQF